MDSPPPQTVFDNLELLEQVDIVKSAFYRQQAQEVLADSRVSLRWRQAIADRLIHANHLLEMQTVNGDDSY
ncbi:hypothetical protein J5X98_13530 [Leptothermofonsia sichuanensis E412]|jgi:hypothetical protein|uniref:hypothetical protein n=1 Tax=Leptothermofonsia sichuanensis TaxID=2917832 RepID=UPI001CA68BC8|nr:hypothetical protein [Leptothermofonsia sichuanensis]QZZ23262.1 hypothetical protein J5X98_13530 [Leptothermofonsia sichuanensis E412]